MFTIPGYAVNQKIYRGNKTIIYSGTRLNDNIPVFLKLLYGEYPDLHDVNKLKKEYELNQLIDSDNIVKIHNIEYYEKTPVLILEDFKGESLKTILSTYKKFDLIDFLKIALKISQSLIDIHSCDVIHKAIVPNHIIVNMENEQMKLTGLGNASLSSDELNDLDRITELETIINYISPEQTGRMNFEIDYRTDFYSLGIVFYEMLTGFLPFKAEDKLGIIHCHLAVKPMSPHENNPSIPTVLSDMVMKLIEKMPNNRYQSAVGLKYDLRKCQESLESTGSIANFILGQSDISDLFQIPDKLYGRKKEIEILKSALLRISKKTKEAIMVTGYSGVGKSQLVNSIRNSIGKHHGYFIYGKFDQFEHNSPYSALIDSFRDLIQQILSENKKLVELWKHKLLNSLGSNAQMVINVIPEIQLIIGNNSEINEVSSEEAKNRFFKVFKDFVKTFCEIQHPLIIFLDDLQWADLSSLKLIEILMTDSEIKNLLFIGAYRDNEVTEIHSLHLTLTNIKKENIRVNTIFLKPLDLDHIKQLLSETFCWNLDESSSLAELSHKKTQGNPFFLSQFLYSLYRKKLIWFNKKDWEWEFDLEKIQNAQITDNVVELISSRISQFPQDTVEILKLASCIGSQFDLNTLSIIYKRSVKDTYASLFKAIKEGMILPTVITHNSMDELDSSTSHSYNFLHDSIQQAAYLLIEEKYRKGIHLKIGRLLLSSTDFGINNGKTLDIINQLNLGLELVYNPFEKKQIAELELLAGRIAKKSTAYDMAYKYIQFGISLMEPLAWESSYELIYSLYVEVTEIACLSGNFEAVEQYSEIALNNSKTVLHKVKLYEIKIIAYTAQNKKLEVLDTALFVLKLLGINFPKNPNQAQVLLSLAKTKLMLMGKQPDSLFELPQMTNSFLCAALHIMTNMGMSTYMLNPNLFSLIILKSMRIYIKHGNLYTSSIGYAAYGMLLCYIGDIDSGYKFGQLALKLLDKFDNKKYIAQTLVVFNCFINFWKLSVKSTLNEYTKAYSIGLETGNINYACTSACLYSISAYYSGQNLIDLEIKMSEYSEFMDKMKNKEALITQSIFHQAVLNLIGSSDNTYYLKGKAYNEDKMIKMHLEIKDMGTLCNLYINKSLLSYLFDEYDEALKNSILAERYLDGVSGTLSFTVFYFYNSLIMLSRFDDYKSLFNKKQIFHKISVNQQKMKKWAQHSKHNFLHKFYLVEAEKSRVLGKILKAINFYKKAIELASKNEYIQDEALANELTAKFYLSLDNKRIAKVYMEQAVYCYTLWGATAKVNYLKDLYPEILNFYKLDSVYLEDTAITSENKTTYSYMMLDTATIIKATHAISGEIKLEELLKKLIYILLENAGAQKVFYLLKKEEKYIIQAEGNIEGNQVDIMKEIDLDDTQNLPKKIIYYVEHSRDSIILDNASVSEKYMNDPYIIDTEPKSVMCMPVLSKGNLLGILYLENNLIEGAFNNERIEIIKIISSQLAISLENATLYTNLERSEKQIREHYDQLEELVEKRTAKLKEEILERKKAQKLLEEMATHDNLTGLANRKLFQSELNYSLELAKANKLFFSIVFIDLDGFKTINDTFGHDGGDIVIKTVAQRLLNSVRIGDIVSRFGGDEFVIIIKNLNNRDVIYSICEKIIDEVGTPIVLGENNGHVTASIGVAIFPHDGDDIENLIKKADDAMYIAKKSGKNQVVFS